MLRSRDHELRFTVHESPDYFKLKVSVFNDDKKTDLIGETWVDLSNLIIPGGSQNDHWHPLQCRGKYAGDIRIEMTYYDTRDIDEAVIGRRKEAAERIQGKTTTTSNAGLSGPRQLDKLKRRPLPTDPSGATPPRPPAPEHAQSAPPLHHPQPSRPAMRDHAQTMPPAPGAETFHLMRHSEPPYEVPSQEHVPSMQTPGMYDGSGERPRDRNASAPALPPAGMMKRNAHELPYPTNEALDVAYVSHPPQHRCQSDLDHQPSQDHRAASEPPFDQSIHGRSQYDSVPPPHDAYSMVSPQYNVNPMTFGQVSTFSPRSSAYADEPAPLNLRRHDTSFAPIEDPRYQSHVRALPPATRNDVSHPEYATMQPRVEDEDEDGPPPPPPVHRSRMAHQAPTPHNQSPSSYTPYTPTHSNNPSMPASLVAGYESEDRIGRPAYEDRGDRRRSTHFDDEMMIMQSSAPVPPPAPVPVPYETPVHPLRASPRPIDERPGSIADRGGSTSPDNRIVTRKSVSPRPPSSGDRGGSQVPFSPDSYNSLNPHASRSTTHRDPSPAYESPSQAREASARPETESVRDPEQPIIGDDGREIDPSDHLPADTWAPEPERKNRKPEVIIRFKHSPRPTSRGNDNTPVRNTPPRVGFKATPDYVTDRPSNRYAPAHVQTDSVDRTPPRAARGLESYGNYTHSQGYTTPTSADRPRSSHRGSVSPTPGSRSPLYDYSPGPPIPSTVPVSGAPVYPVSSSQGNGVRPGMDALSRELSTIDIGSVGCSPSRAVRKYAPRSSATMGYAS